MLPEISVTALTAASLYKVLGPAAGEVGEAVRRMTEYRLRNVGRVIENAATKTPEEEGGEVPTRAAMRLVEDASYSDDDVIIEYLGGVLASSHTLVGRDDRGVTWSAMIATLSTYQLRTHYLLYREFRRHLIGREVNFGSGDETQKLELFLPMDEYLDAMELSDEERASDDDDSPNLLGHILFGLHRHSLIGTTAWAAGDSEFLGRARALERAGMVVTPSAVGVELYLWAHGLGQSPLGVFLRDETMVAETTLPPMPSSGILEDLLVAKRQEEGGG